MRAEKHRPLVHWLKLAGLFLAIAAVLAAAFFVWYGAHLTEPEINGYQGLYYAAKLSLTGETAMQYTEEPPRFFISQDSEEGWKEAGVKKLYREGSQGVALFRGEMYIMHYGSFTSRYARIDFKEATAEEVTQVVFHDVRNLCLTRYGCDEAEMDSTFDELNITADERSDLALTLEEMYGVPVPDEALENFVTLEDMVGYIEDRL